MPGYYLIYRSFSVFVDRHTSLERMGDMVDRGKYIPIMERTSTYW